MLLSARAVDEVAVMQLGKESYKYRSCARVYCSVSIAKLTTKQSQLSGNCWIEDRSPPYYMKIRKS
ncbi:MAG: hypothetical protein U7126_31470 [Microcoleus sp.]